MLPFAKRHIVAESQYLASQHSIACLPGFWCRATDLDWNTGLVPIAVGISHLVNQERIDQVQAVSGS